MTSKTVTWRQAVAAIAAVVVGLLGFVVVFRSDGISAVDASAARSTRWFAHQPTGTIVLADGYGGKALARMDAEAEGEQIAIAEGASGAYVLNDNTAEVRPIETADLQFGASIGLSALGGGQAVAAVGPAGLTVVNPVDDQATALPLAGEPLTFAAATTATTVVAPEGVVWTIDGSILRRISSTSSIDVDLGLGPDALLSLVGNDPFVVDPGNRRARLGEGAWQQIATESDPSEMVVQQPGPATECGWVGADDDLWCVSTGAIDEQSTVAGLDIDGSSLLAIAGDVSVLVRRGPSAIVRFDWRNGRIVDDVSLSVAPDEALAVTSTVDLVWIDEIEGDNLWGINPWVVTVVDKAASDTYVVGQDGEIVDTEEADESSSLSNDEFDTAEQPPREPDNNGIDDPPVAVDDAVTARSGSSVPVQVTSNDYDPDGEAVAVNSVGTPGHGTVEIAKASTVAYTPDAGYVGLDTFEYTIVDGNGTESTATVVVELLPATGANQAPIGRPDEAETGPRTPVIVDVLLNDIDPERDSLRIGSFTPADGPGGEAIGEVTETVGPSGLKALRFEPAAGFEGTAIFSYRPIDALEGQGDDVDVRVEVAEGGATNRPPIAASDAIRVRRSIPAVLPVLDNDSDPDGDDLTISVVTPLPDGLDVAVEGEQLSLLVKPGAADLLPFQYEVDDGRGGTAIGAVLVVTLDDAEPNLAPVLAPDFDTVVVGSSVAVDVLANDTDPDGDPLVIVDVTQPGEGLGQAVVASDIVQFTPGSIGEREETAARFTYTVSDGNGHEATGEVNVSILREALAQPPYARDDSAFTYVDSPVTVDVLRNDGDPSGERPTLVGTPGCAAGGRASVTADGQVRFDPPSGQTGAFRCSYEVTNSQGLRADASIIVSVREPALTNQPPVVANDSLTLEVGSTGTIDVTSNDVDPDGGSASLTLVSSTSPTLGSATRRGNVITFTAGQTPGVTGINYQVADSEGAVSLGRLVVTITERENRPPIAVPDSRTITGPGVPVFFDVLANDADPDGNVEDLIVQSAAVVSGDGDVSPNGRIVTLTPEPSFEGSLVVSYTIADPEGLTSSALVTLTVLEPLNRAPIARDDVAEVANGGTVTVPVLFNDSDPDGDPITIAITSGADSVVGSARLNGDRTITFTAFPGATGTAVIGYQISDDDLSANGTLRVAVRPCDESAPTAGDGFLRTGYQQPIGVDLAALSSNGTVVDVRGPAGFTDGVYTPPAGENGNVTISYGVVNSCRQRDDGTVTIDVNQNPIGRPQSFTVGRGDRLEVPVTNLASDDEPLTIVSADGAPSWVGVQASKLTLAPPVGTSLGAATWSVVVADPGGLTVSVPVTVTVVNKAPIGTPDRIDVNAGTPVEAALLDNDVDPDGVNSDLRLVSVSTSSLVFPNGGTGSVTFVGDRAVSVDPGSGRGSTTFSYTLSDQIANAGPVTVTVVGPALNIPPSANDQTVTTPAFVPVVVALDVGDAEGDPLVVTDRSDPSGVVVGQAGLTFTMVSLVPGTYSVSYRVFDGTDYSRTATITFIVT